ARPWRRFSPSRSPRPAAGLAPSRSPLRSDRPVQGGGYRIRTARSMSRTIADIRIHPISVPLERAFWMSLEPYTTAAEIVVEIETDDGLVGIGEIHGRPQGEIARILDEGFKPLLLGEDALDHERLWDLLFRSTF